MTNSSSRKSIAVTPVIRAKTSADAFVATGHNHDDRYIRYDATQSGLSSSELNQFLTNLNAATATDAKLVRTDITQSLSVSAKDRARENIGLVDDTNVADGSGNISVSSFGNRIGGANVTNNDLLEHFLRHDAAQTITSTKKEQLASNGSLLSLLSGLSTQTVQSAVTFSAATHVISGKPTMGASTITGTPLSDTLATVRIGNPDGTRTSIIHISSAVGTTDAVTAISCGSKRIEALADPSGAQDAATKNYVDTQLDGLDLDGAYYRIDGQNSGEGSLNLGNNKIINMSTPTASGDGANKAYVDGNVSILSGTNNGTAGGFTPASTTIAVTATGKYLVILSGKVTSASSGVLNVNVLQDVTTLATRYINTDGDSQWSLTIPVTVSGISDPLKVSGSAGVVFNQFDVVKLGT